MSSRWSAGPRWWRESPNKIGDAAAVIMAVALLLTVAGAIGYISAQYGQLAIAAAIAVLAIGLASTDVALLPVLAFPAVLLTLRAGPLSVTDLVLIAATVPAFLLYRREEAKSLQPLIWLGIAYQAMLIPTVLLNPYLANFIEWGHEMFMVIGSLLVGWVVGRRGYASAALRLYVLGCTAIGIAAFIIASIMLVREGSFGPVYMWEYHKNFTGNACAFAFLIVFLRPDWLPWGRRFSRWTMLATGAGVAASGARQSIVAIAVTILLMSLRRKEGGGGRGRILLFALIPALWFVANTLSEQLAAFAGGDKFNSAAQRLVWFGQSLEIWEQAPVFGVGLRWWYTPEFAQYSFQPPNAIFEMLSSAGVVGLIAWIVLVLGGLWILFTMEPRYGNLPAAILFARVVQGQLDLYWLAGLSALPWMIAGLAIGVKALHHSQGQDAANPEGSDDPPAAVPDDELGVGSQYPALSQTGASETRPGQVIAEKPARIGKRAKAP